jgi:hypothetical protein
MSAPISPPRKAQPAPIENENPRLIHVPYDVYYKHLSICDWKTIRGAHTISHFVMEFFLFEDVHACAFCMEHWDFTGLYLHSILCAKCPLLSNLFYYCQNNNVIIVTSDYHL